MAASTCPECRKGTLHWETRSDAPSPFDVFCCDRCAYVMAREDWRLPEAPLRRGACWNCGGARGDGACVDCALTEEDDRALHEELHHLIHPTASRLSSAQLAVATGRRILALKLATAEAHGGAQSETARLLRLQILRLIGQSEASLADARQWTLDAPEEVAAWGAYAEALVQDGRSEDALPLFERALALNPDAHRLRARQAQLFFELGRHGQAQLAASRVLAQRGDRDATLAALDVMAGCVERLIEQRDAPEVRRTLDALAERARRHPALLAASGWLALEEDQPKRARRELREARKLQEDHPLIDQVEAALDARRRWWRLG